MLEGIRLKAVFRNINDHMKISRTSLIVIDGAAALTKKEIKNEKTIGKKE